MISKISGFFATLSPNAKKYTVIGVGIAGLLGVITALVLMQDNSGGTTRRVAATKKKDKINYDVLTGTNTKSLSGDALVSQVKTLQEEVRQLRTKGGDKFKGNDGDQQGSEMPEFASSDQGAGSGPDKFIPKSIDDAVDASKPDVNSKDAELIERIKRQQEEKRRAAGKGGNGPAAKTPKAVPDPVQSADDSMVIGDQKPGGMTPVTGLGSPAAPGASRIMVFDEQSQVRRNGSTSGATGAPGSPTQPGTQPEIANVSGRVPAKGAKKEDKSTLSLPIGSILSGTIITGMDAPTASQSKRDPFPALLRIKHEAILPNRFRMDLKECFVIAAGYGDMASERAYLRAEAISCVTNDGEVLESPIDAYAVGEDGKTGVRGRLVSKTGAIIGRSLLAGFLGGITNTLKPAQVPSLNLSPGNTAQFQRPSGSQVLDESLIGGVSGAANEVSKYYIEMAKNIFPVIEVDAGRSVDFIVTRSARLAPGAKNNNRNHAGVAEGLRNGPQSQTVSGVAEGAISQISNSASKFFQISPNR
ncbi:TraB/VirB10 family protein [Duganella vulcania]|uniref:Conjugal transfer protein TraB n=1 Tax=Duganella vulcania TaxID=2692166 RepID=A0A845GH38_9BURK|nr:TraB/VirB10 family protein [Duganella vulcania]MYM92715.1 hypothetical protein [Duganella vulcania]